VRSNTAAREILVGSGTGGRIVPDRVVQTLRRWVWPCGPEALNRLESWVEDRYRSVQALVDAPPDDPAWRQWLGGILSTRPHRETLLSELPRDRTREILRSAQRGAFGPGDVESIASQIRGAPREVCRDIAADLLHCAAPDRLALLARWVCHPERGRGILTELAEPPPRTYEEAQARLGELRLQVARLGFPSRTFAAVDVVLALAYAGLLSDAAQETFHSGGLETLLPGNYGLATMVLGVRRRRSRADR
jgi:hypothetical protein